MLYKKTHRQYLREWRVGRKFKVNGKVYEITKEEPFIEYGSIFVDGWCLIPIGGEYSGKVWYKFDYDLEWLN